MPEAPFRVPARLLARVFAAALAIAMGCGASAARAETTAVQTRTVIVTPLSVVKIADMDFGDIISPAASGTVTLTPTATTACTTTGGLIRSGTCQAATFRGLGETNQVVRLRFTSGQTMTLSNGLGQTMTVTDRTVDGMPSFTHLSGNTASNGNIRYRITSLDGAYEFRVGGRLNVGANQAQGHYSGTFTVTVEYD